MYGIHDISTANLDYKIYMYVKNTFIYMSMFLYIIIIIVLKVLPFNSLLSFSSRMAPRSYRYISKNPSCLPCFSFDEQERVSK